MARNIRWQIPFKSLDNKSCRIDIYDEGYTGSVVILSDDNDSTPGYPAPDAFYFEEDDSENLLDVFRIKTGYINLIEAEPNSLIDLFPTSDMQRYVEMYYDSVLMFTGFIQVQAFDINLNEYHREISLPIQSPLALASGLYMPNYSNVYSVSCNGALATVMLLLNASYTSFVIPQTYNYFNIRAKVLSPITEKPEGVNDGYSPITVREFLEGICNLWGLILHDTPTQLVFSKVDYNDIYSNGTTYGSDTYNLLSEFALFKDANTQANILPCKKVTVSYDGDTATKLSAQLDGCVYSDQQIVISPLFVKAAFVFLRPIADNIYIPYGRFLGTNTISNPAGALSDKGVMLVHAELAGNSQYKGMLIKYNATWSPDSDIATFRFGSLPFVGGDSDNMIFTYVNVDAYIGSTFTEAFEANDKFSFNIYIKCGSLFYGYDSNNNPVWSSNPYTKKHAVNRSSVGVWLQTPPPEPHIEVVLLASNSIDDAKYIYINDVTFETSPVVLSEYKEEFRMNRTIKGTIASRETADVTCMFSLKRQNMNTLLSDYWDDGRLPDDPEDTKVTVVEPSYAYILQAQDRVVLSLKAVTLPPNIYLKRWAFMSDTTYWRVVAITFNPMDDEYIITLHHSSLF